MVSKGAHVLHSSSVGTNFSRFGGNFLNAFQCLIYPYAYSVSNDTVYYYRKSSISNELTKRYLGLGSESELRLKHCFTYHSEENGQQGGSGFDPKYYHTFEDNSYFQSPEDMGPNDTLVLFNQTRLYQ